MARDVRLSRRLAMVLLSGSWSVEGLRERLRAVFRPPSRARWISPLAHRIYKRFEASPLRPTNRQLVDFLNRDEILWDKLCQEDLIDGVQCDLLALPRPRMASGPGLPELSNLPALVTPGELADWLAVCPTQLDWLADCHGRERLYANSKLRHYHYRFVPKIRKGHRLIEEPKPLLKSLQRRILNEILNSISPHEAAHAFRSGRSVLSYVTPHVGRDWVLHLDLRDFFPTVRQPKIRSLFRWLGYPEAVAHLLAGLCMNSAPSEILRESPDWVAGEKNGQWFQLFSNPHLPQGSPTSPALANLAAYRLDCRLSGLARKAGVNYTRYADDLVFSGKRIGRKNLSRFRIAVMAIAMNEGFEVHHQKTRVMMKGKRQKVAGLVVNRHPNILREDFDRLKAILFNCIRYGPESQNRAGQENFKEHLRGRIAYHARINSTRENKLQRLFDQISW